MKRNELARYVKDYVPLFGDEWKYDSTRLLRQEGEWIQCVEFRAHGYWSSYIIVHGLIHLKEPIIDVDGKPIKPLPIFLIQDLLWDERASIQSEVDLKNHSDNYLSLFNLMVEKFEPAINKQLSSEIVFELLGKPPLTWHPLYTLCIHFAEIGNHDLAVDYFNQFSKRIEGLENHPVFGQRLKELKQVINLMESDTVGLISFLNDWQLENLKLLKWDKIK